MTHNYTSLYNNNNVTLRDAFIVAIQKSKRPEYMAQYSGKALGDDLKQMFKHSHIPPAVANMHTHSHMKPHIYQPNAL